MDSTFLALQHLGRDLKKSLDISSSSDIDRELKDLASSIESVRDSFERAKKSQEVNVFFLFFFQSHSKRILLFRKMNYYVIVSNEH
jgi:hypothetical protein